MVFHFLWARALFAYTNSICHLVSWQQKFGTNQHTNTHTNLGIPIEYNFEYYVVICLEVIDTKCKSTIATATAAATMIVTAPVKLLACRYSFSKTINQNIFVIIHSEQVRTALVTLPLFVFVCFSFANLKIWNVCLHSSSRLKFASKLLWPAIVKYFGIFINCDICNDKWSAVAVYICKKLSTFTSNCSNIKSIIYFGIMNTK